MRRRFLGTFVPSVALAGLVLAVPVQSQMNPHLALAASTRPMVHHAAIGNDVISVPRAPSLQPLNVKVTELSQAQISSDVTALASLFSAHPGDGTTYGPDQLVYHIDATINPSEHELAGHLLVHFHNNLTQPISTVYFNVWPDAPHYRWSGGYTSVSNVTVDGISTPFSLHGTLMQVPLARAIPENESATISLSFLSLLPHIVDRYGWDGTTLNIANWFPILAVHDSNGWVTPPYYTDGESFYSLTGAFHLNVTAPKNLVMAITGEPSSPATDAGNGMSTVHYQAIGVRDVAMEADPMYHVQTTKQGNTTIYTYFTSADASEAAELGSQAQQSLAAYETWYGPYPYASLRVCAVPGYTGGMEYPQLVQISLHGADPSEIESTVVHEVAHQWFYGMVGDDQYLTPFVDEAFACFSENRFDGMLQMLTSLAPMKGKPSDPVSAFASSDFPNHVTGNSTPDDYARAVYDGGAAALYALMNKLGTNRFNQLMQAYFHQYQYRVATITDFIRFVSQFMNSDMTPFFKSYGVDPVASEKAPVQPWATLEEAQNERSWH